MKRVIVDTNSYSNLFKGNLQIEQELSSAEKVFISVITLGELCMGFKQGNKEKENLRYLKNFLQKSTISIAEVNKDTSLFYAEIKFHLRRKGTPIPDNDIWIAAQAKETNSKLITFDRHFLGIPGIKIWGKLKQ